MKWGSGGAMVLLVAAVAGCNAGLLTGDEETPARAHVELLASRDEAPTWAVRYGDEFWRRATTDAKPVNGASDVPIGDVIDRVSHAIDCRDSVPSVRARTYRATFDGPEIRFSPRSSQEVDASRPALRIQTTSITAGSAELFRAGATTTQWFLLGNTDQALLAETGGIVEHREARADGVELTWVVRDRSAIPGPLEIRVAIDGIRYAARTESGFHFADDERGAGVRIGNATLVDAGGQLWPVTTKVSEAGASWTIDSETLASATFPLALDPTISAEIRADEPVPSPSGSFTLDWSLASNGDGFLVAWADTRNGDWHWDDPHDFSNPLTEVYAARIDSAGVVLDPGGLHLPSSKQLQSTPSVASDGTNYLVVWADRPDALSDSDIHGARVTAAGVVEDPDSLTISAAARSQWAPAASSNGTDYFVVWADGRDSTTTGHDIYGTRVSAAGVVASPDGTVISAEYHDQDSPCIASNGTDYLVAWTDARNWISSREDIYGARVTGAGTVIDEKGIAISTAADAQTAPALASVGDEYLVVWEDRRPYYSTNTNLYGARVTSSGTVLDPAGLVLTDDDHASGASVASDGANYYVIWRDVDGVRGTLVDAGGVAEHQDGVVLLPGIGATSLEIVSNGSEFFVLFSEGYAPMSEALGARLDSAGNVMDPNGIALAIAANSEREVAVGANGSEYLVAWADDRNGNRDSSDIYATRISDAGEVIDLTAFPISTAGGNQRHPAVASNGVDFFVAWTNADDANARSSSVSGTRVTAAGLVEDPAGIALSGSTAALAAPSIASSGADYLVVWSDGRNEASGIGVNIYGTRISATGDALDPDGIAISSDASSYQDSPSVASNDNGYLVAWRDRRPPDKPTARGTRVSSAGLVLESAGIALSSSNKFYSGPAVASNGTDYLVAWINGSGDTQNEVWCTRVTGSGSVLDPDGVVIWTGSGPQYSSSVSLGSDGTGYLAAWTNRPVSPTGSNIIGSRISADGTVQDVEPFTISATVSYEDNPKVAAIASSYLITYSTSTRVAARLLDDNDECALSAASCSPHATCVDLLVGHSCVCNNGYAGDGQTCTDIDECASGSKCAGHATCTNLVGGYDCTCDPGYSGDGHTCTNADQCAPQLDTCGAHATCTKLGSNYMCSCDAGYAGDGNTCSDVDECSGDTDNCSENATCTNTSGGFTCACNTGFTGDGVTCDADGNGSNEGESGEDGGGCSATRSDSCWLALLCIGFAIRRRRRRNVRRYRRGMRLRGAKFLLVAAVAGCNAGLLTGDEEAPARVQVDQLASRDAAPTWTVRYGEEFWRRTTPTAKPVNGASDVPIGDVIDRVSHAIEWHESVPSVRAKTYRATFEGSELRFAPRPARAADDATPELRFHTTSISSGSDELFRDGAGSVSWAVFGNTMQAQLSPSADIVEHREARADGIELTWVVRDRSALADDLRIEVAIEGLGYVEQDGNGIHYADGTSRARVQIASAVLVDASGKQWPVATEVTERGARWHVDRAILADATFPVALDPNISPEVTLDDPVLISGGTAKGDWSIASNGEGYLLVWVDVRSRRYAYDPGYDDERPRPDIYAARIDASGLLLDPGGFQLSTGDQQHDSPSVASDGTDYLVVWRDMRNEPWGQDTDIYGTRVTAAGVVEDPDNIPIGTIAGNQADPDVSSNGTDYLVVWFDVRNTTPGAGIYCTHVSSAGVVASPDGVKVWPGSSPRVASNGTDYLIAWQDRRNAGTTGTDIYGARISAAGVVLDDSGFAISTAPNGQGMPVLASDGADYVVVWNDARNGNTDIYGTRVSAAGTVLDGNGFVVTDAPSDQGPPSIASDGAQYFVTWSTPTADDRAEIYGTAISTAGILAHEDGVRMFPPAKTAWPLIASNGTGYFVLWADGYVYTHEAYGARLTGDGTVVDPNGIELAIGTNTEWQVAAASNGSEYLVVWSDDRNGGESELDIYGVRVSDSGQILDPMAIPISTAPGPQLYPAIASDGSGYFVVWNDAHLPGPGSVISGTRVTADGKVEDPTGIALSGNTGAFAPPAVASSGTEYLAVWGDGRNASGNGMAIYGTRVATTGVVMDPAGIAIADGDYPSIASNGSNYFVTWWYRPSAYLFGSRVTTNGVVQDTSGIPIDVSGLLWSIPAVASNGTDYLVAWIKVGGGNHVVCSAVTSAGVVQDVGGVAISSTGWNLRVSVASDGVGYFAAWESINPDPIFSVYGAPLAADGSVEAPDRLPISAGVESEMGPKVASTGSSYLVAYTSSIRAAARLVSDTDYPADDDECALHTDNCSSNATCSNRYVGFACTCKSGYAGDGLTCTDIDECSNNACGIGATCTNTVGSYECTCNAGFSDSGHTCLDINECALNMDDCGALATCTNTPGAFLCACNAGYSGDGHTCVDIDECAIATDTCAAQATCTNTNGGYACTCMAGYSGDGHSCSDLDECALGSSGCAPQATCVNTSGGYLCACNDGYAGDGSSCIDVDECALRTDDCSRNATCANTDGGFACTCNAGFIGDGITCTQFGGAFEPVDDGDAPLIEAGGGCEATHSSSSWVACAFVAFALRRRRRRRTCM